MYQNKKDYIFEEKTKADKESLFYEIGEIFPIFMIFSGMFLWIFSLFKKRKNYNTKFLVFLFSNYLKNFKKIFNS